MSRFVVTAGWNDAVHLDARAIADLEASIPPDQLAARRDGTPALGSGKIYPVDETLIVVPDFPIPKHFACAYALDVGWRKTAALWGALNRDTDVLYVFSEHYESESIPAVHAESIKGRGKWIPGLIDPAANGRSQIDGEQLIEIYSRLGLDLENADNAVSAGIYEVWQRFVSGRLKIFKSLVNLIGELRLYRRDSKGKIVKERDHLCDCLRYLSQGILARARCAPAPPSLETRRSGGSKWSG